jgi:hypothetical protein
MKTNRNYLLVMLLVFFILGAVPLAFAAEGGTGGGVTIEQPGGDLIGIIDRVTKFLIAIAVPITAIMVIWGAFQILTAADNPEQFRKGRTTIVYAAMGFGIVLLSQGVVSIVKQLIGG